jgi:hypothetical protein
MEDHTIRTFGFGEVNGIPVYSITLEVGQDMVDVTTIGGSKPDEGWEFRDGAGHYHAWTKDGKLPTLKLRLKEHIPCHDYDECGCPGTDVMANYCVVCDEEVEPKRVHDPGPHYIPGRSWWTAEVSGAVLHQGTDVVLMFRSTGPDGVLPARQRVRFGVARVTSTALHVDEPARARLSGIGELGER